MIVLKGLLLYFTILIVTLFVSGIDYLSEYILECAVTIGILCYICCTYIGIEDLKKLLFYESSKDTKEMQKRD